MSILGDITNTLTGGENGAAENNQQKALKNFENLQAPTTAQLTIPQLQQYVQAGIMTPAQAQAYLVNNNSYDNVQLDPASMNAEYSALSQLQNDANPAGNDAEAKLAEQNALDASTSALRGEEGANTLLAEQRGVAPQLATMAANEADIGNNANALFAADQQAAAGEEARQLQALQNSATTAGNIEGQKYSADSNKAAAANAIAQFNAQNQTAVSGQNAGYKQAANAANTQNAQNVSNANTSQNNNRTIYNSTTAPQQSYEDAVQKAAGQSGAANALSGTQLNIGGQNMAVAGAIANGVQNGLSSSGSGAGAGQLAGLMYDGGEVDMAKGGMVPGHAPVAGNSPSNDIVPAKVGQKPIRLSPGEVVLPRTVSQHPTPDKVMAFLHSLPKYHQQVPKENQVHPHDIAKVLQGLSAMRGGQA